jgi:hypothetical protein
MHGKSPNDSSPPQAPNRAKKKDECEELSNTYPDIQFALQSVTRSASTAQPRDPGVKTR